MDVNKPTIEAVDYQPLEGDVQKHRRPLALGLWVLGFTLASTALVMLYLTMARSVIFNLSPATSEISVSGFAFNMAGNFLLLPGEYQIAVSAVGYRKDERAITVGEFSEREIDIALQPLPGDLIINSSLDNLTATLDGELLLTALPGLISDISRGDHQLVVSRERYVDMKYSVNIVGLGTKQTLDVDLAPAWGYLNISTTPSAAEIIVDGQPLGVTPIRAEILSTGSRVELHKPGYRTWMGDLRVIVGSSAVYPPIELLVADGRAIINSEPNGASVTLDGQFEGLTPLQINVRPNSEHRVKLFLDGYLKSERSFSVAAAAEIEIDVVLAENIVEVALNVSPEDSEIFVDDRQVESGDQTLRLTAKPHQLQVRREGYTTKTRELLPTPGQEQSVTVTLLTEEATYWASRPPRINAFGNIQMALMRPEKPFTMGAPRREPGRRANEVEREVVLSRPFYLGIKEVSNKQFRLWYTKHSSSAISEQTLDMEEQPAAMVSWEDAARFCNWLSARDNLKPFYRFQLTLSVNIDSHYDLSNAGRFKESDWSANGYRLPTEAEWAWAAKIRVDGSTAMFGWNSNRYPPSDIVANYADASAEKTVRFIIPNYRDDYPVSSAVGSFKANARGLYNMYGNVAEWTNDYYRVLPHKGAPLENPRGPRKGVRRVVRGASWALGSRSELRTSFRYNGNTARRDLGFRIARYVDTIEATQ